MTKKVNQTSIYSNHLAFPQSWVSNNQNVWIASHWNTILQKNL